MSELDILEVIANNLSIELDLEPTGDTKRIRVVAKLKLAGQHLFDSTISSDYVDINLD